LRRSETCLTDADPTSTSVIEIAYSCGFLHLGRFAADYRKKCGVSPSHTLRAGRWTNVAHDPATRLS
jgi:transcriptional regulator GlxA family with amidase domain